MVFLIFYGFTIFHRQNRTPRRSLSGDPDLKVTRMLLDVLFRFYLYVVGVRFYETTAVPSSAEFMSLQTIATNDSTMEFKFFREVCHDHVFRRGELVRREFVGYMIRCHINETGMPDSIYRFNNFRLFFKNKHLQRLTDKSVCRFLMAIFVRYMQAELKKNKA